MAKRSRVRRRPTRPRVLIAAERAIATKIRLHKEALAEAKPPYRRKLRIAIRELRRTKGCLRAAFLGRTCPPPPL